MDRTRTGRGEGGGPTPRLRIAATVLLGAAVAVAPGCRDGGDPPGSAEGTGGTDAGDAADVSDADGVDDADGTTAATEDGSTGEAPDPTAPLFDRDHIVQVEIELPPEDWDTLRRQSRAFSLLIGEDCQDEPFANPFTWFAATVTVDGVTLDDVGVRKKGFLGSMDEDKPSLKLDFAEYIAGQRAHGVKRMTLNNARQDEAVIRQCLSYELFARAGLPAPRCNFASVTVNGQALGPYVHVEPVKKPFLARHFQSDEGNLYEGTLSDLRDGWLGTFEKKTNKDDPAMDDLHALTDVVAVEGATFSEGLATQLDLEHFFDFWAMEVLIGHWDGYAGNTNNYFVYRRPADDRFVFLPWGVDGVLGLGGDSAPYSVMTTGVIAHRLYEEPTSRQAYRARLQTLLDRVWDEPTLLAEVDRMEALVDSVPGFSFADDLAAEVEGVRAFIAGRRAQVQAELDGLAPPSPVEPRDSFCFLPTGEVELSFETSWGTHETDPFAAGSGTFAATFFGESVVPSPVGSTAGISVDEDTRRPQAEVRVFGELPSGELGLVIIALPLDRFEAGTQETGFGDVSAVAVQLDPDAPGDSGVTVLGSLFGDFVLEAASQRDGATVRGTLRADALHFGG